ncbi:MAG: hypothetical protein KatS3mg108_3248 [Isosphaeraceae bacterium]|jgi:hypothetical protein|nr:MAG: hypothetical protein KatS3mg108_3248 [Isosphaeraceae bacterium]
MPPRSNGFFRGSELPRLIFLIGLLVVGSALVYRILSQQPSRQPARPVPVAQRTPLPPPDDSFELSGVIDRQPLNPRENPGYLLLLERVRQTPPEALARAARRDVLFSQLVTNPARYRGLPIRVEGTLLRLLEQHPIDSQLFPDGRFYEGWTITPDSQDYPWILVFENAPPNLPVGDDLRAYISFDGYFFKLMAYVAGDTTRFAPLLIGRLRFVDPEPTASEPATLPSLPWWAPLLAVLALYGLVRWLLFLRQLTRPSPSRRYFSAVDDQIDPKLLTDWLNSSSDTRVVTEPTPSDQGSTRSPESTC